MLPTLLQVITHNGVQSVIIQDTIIIDYNCLRDRSLHPAGLFTAGEPAARSTGHAANPATVD